MELKMELKILHTFKPLYKQNKNGRWQQYIVRVFTKGGG